MRALADAERRRRDGPGRDLARRHALGRGGYDVSRCLRAPDAVTFARVAHFGNWLRIAADLPDGGAMTVLVTIHLKG